MRLELFIIGFNSSFIAYGQKAANVQQRVFNDYFAVDSAKIKGASLWKYQEKCFWRSKSFFLIIFRPVLNYNQVFVKWKLLHYKGNKQLLCKGLYSLYKRCTKVLSKCMSESLKCNMMSVCEVCPPPPCCCPVLCSRPLRWRGHRSRHGLYKRWTFLRWSSPRPEERAALSFSAWLQVKENSSKLKVKMWLLQVNLSNVYERQRRTYLNWPWTDPPTYGMQLHERLNFNSKSPL